MRTRLASLFCIAACVCVLDDPARAQQDVAASVTLLLDFSRSFAPYDKGQEAALRGVMTALETLSTRTWTPPVRIFANAIEKASVSAKPPCGSPVVYDPKMVVRNKVEGHLYRPNDLHAWTAACVVAIVSRSQSTALATDISGAVALASQDAQGAPGAHAIVMVSDFLERLGSAKPTQFKLNGERVVMVWRPAAEDQSDQNLIFSRLDGWQRRLREAGASKVCRIPLVSLSAGDVVQCLS